MFHTFTCLIFEKFTRVTWVASCHTIFEYNSDIEGMIVTHCELDFFEVLDIKVPFACLVRQKLFVVHLNFDLRG